MNKTEFEQKVRIQEKAEMARIKAISNAKPNLITSSESPYHQFELSFGANLLHDLNSFLFSLDKTEFDCYPNLNSPLLKLCQKFLDWKVEIGSGRLWHELLILDIDGKHIERNSGYSYIIKKAWEEIKKEQGIIETARQAHKDRLNKILEDNPSLPSTDPAQWIALCDDFSVLNALQEFGYPLPFKKIFGSYSENPQDSIKLAGE